MWFVMLLKAIGMKTKFKETLMRTPIAATKLSCLRLPLAVSKVPKMYVIDIDTKLPIRICNILDDSDILMLYSATDSLS